MVLESPTRLNKVKNTNVKRIGKTYLKLHGSLSIEIYSRVLLCDTYSRDINDPNNTVIPEREGTNDVESEGGGEQLKGEDIQWSYHGRRWMIKKVEEANTDVGRD